MPHLVLPCHSGLHSMRVSQRGIGFYSHILKDLGEHRESFLVFILCSQLSPRYGSRFQSIGC